MNDDEQLELDIPEEPLTEEGLEEDIKRNEKRRQEEYDEATKGNEELRRRQTRRGRGGDVEQLDIPGLFEAGSGLRTTAALGTEIFLNTLVDPVLEPGTQIAAGSLINALAQRIRGGKFSAGEVTAAGLASLIPGAAQGRAITQFTKGVGKGALSGAIETAGAAGIDEGRLPTKEELALGLGIGAAFGGAISTPQGIKAIGELRNKVGDASYDLVGALTRAGISSDSLIKQGGSPAIPPPKTPLTSIRLDWTKFGYQKPARTLPTQVRKVLGTDLEDEVANSLWNQYNRANEFLKKNGTLRGFGEKFVNPANNKLYYIQRTRGKNPRLTLLNQETKLRTARVRREKDIQSTPLQTILRRYKTKNIAKLNEVEEAKFKEATDPIIRRIQINGKTIHRYNQYPDIQESIAAQIAEDGLALDKITEGYHYGEHGHALRSKVWNYVKRVKRFANQNLLFRPGDAKNYHLVFEPNKRNQQFKILKDDFENIIESTIGKNQARYPDVMVNYNPVLSGPGKKIRFERLSTLKLGYKTRAGKLYPDTMYGDLIAEYDVDKLGVPTPAQMQKWLDQNLPGEKRVGPKGKLKQFPTFKKKVQRKKK